MQMQKFFRRYSHGDVTVKVLSLETFVLPYVYGKAHIYNIYVTFLLQELSVVLYGIMNYIFNGVRPSF